MLLPALTALSFGELNEERQSRLHDMLQLRRGTPRTEGYGSENSIAHREFTDETGHRLVLDLGKVDEDGWVFGLYFDGGRPSPSTVEAHRTLFRGLMEWFGLQLVQITPAATADEVLVPSVPPEAEGEDGLGVSWNFSYDRLEQLRSHVGLSRDAPREVKEVKLRALMGLPIWSAAPEPLRSEAEAFLHGG
ncbi:hypothetical protein [Nocardiopsis alba]|uniref:Uncharacterized protein n=2 Tax=Nocardiopsis alba TaxID=53437 RepID=J7LCW9_NOCAA|nr:hypothetical protein B005_5161 [Nocardiopsis alba ATCC BAA-2165]